MFQERRLSRHPKQLHKQLLKHTESNTRRWYSSLQIVTYLWKHQGVFNHHVEVYWLFSSTSRCLCIRYVQRDFDWLVCNLKNNGCRWKLGEESWGAAMVGQVNLAIQYSQQTQCFGWDIRSRQPRWWVAWLHPHNI